MGNWFNDRYYRLSKCHDVIKNVATIFYIIADIVFWFSVVGGTIWAITAAIDSSKPFKAFFAIFLPVIVTAILSYFGTILTCHFVFSWGEKIEHTKKQTELLKIMSLEKK